MKILKRKTIVWMSIVSILVILFAISGLLWKNVEKEPSMLIYGEWEFQREITLNQDGESAFPIGDYTYPSSINEDIPANVLKSLALTSFYKIEAADGLILHELPSGAVVKYYVQPVYQQYELTMKNWYTQKKCTLLEPQAPKMKMVFTNLGDEEEFEEIYEAGADGKYRVVEE